MVISIYTINTYAKQSLNIFSATLSEQIQPAVIFNDRITLQQTLNNHIQQYPIRVIKVINLQGKPLAEAYKPTPEFAWMENLFDKVFFKHPLQAPLNIKTTSTGH
ncbi:CHASE sensor domain-containing protein [Acinetobacter johnsonii]|uniref:CHASE sensor domain-containing protein n=1 Tax=Acinetobacter johnsonii TaxID=40214 RepID=UPI001D0F151B|nr:CHASE sensor domain-containing protein [Acinetobacter johnsonii]